MLLPSPPPQASSLKLRILSLLYMARLCHE
ncbi:Uncharacterised protein [Bordetella pertussis]|nr:Uncharacterised protein [Bordetella pertussis]